MARIRTIKPDYYEDPDLCSVSLEAAFLFPRLWQEADARGIFRVEPERLWLSVFALRFAKTQEPRFAPDRIEGYLRELGGENPSGKAFVHFFEENGRRYGLTRSFDANQRIKPDEWDALARGLLATSSHPEPASDPTWSTEQVTSAIKRVLRGKPPQGVTWIPPEELPTRYRLCTDSAPTPDRVGAYSAPTPRRGVNREGNGNGNGNGKWNGNGVEESPPTPQGAETPPEKADLWPPDEFLRDFNATACACGWRKAQAIDGKRLRALNARKREPGWIPKARTALRTFQSQGCDSFLSGGGPRGWKAGPDWFLKPDTVQRASEGEWEPKAPPGKPRRENAQERAERIYRQLRAEDGETVDTTGMTLIGDDHGKP